MKGASLTGSRLPTGRNRSMRLPPIEGMRWALGDASLSYYNPTKIALKVRVTLDLVGVDEREVSLFLEGRERARVELQRNETIVLSVEFTLVPGVNVVEFRSDRPAVRLNQERWSLRAFGLKRLEWDVIESEAWNSL
jgi:hypothetical protein